MKASRSIVNSRREKILETVRSEGDVTVSTLAEQLQVSPLTIRRDLQYLQEHQLLERFYGGARTGTGEKVKQNSRELRKEKIARYAASLVEDRDSIFINTSSTALAMVKYIKSRNVTIITNNGNVVDEENPSQATIILLGGELRYTKGAMVGDFTRNNLAQVTAKKCFMGCSGLSPDIGMTTEMVSEVKPEPDDVQARDRLRLYSGGQLQIRREDRQYFLPAGKHRKYHHGFGSPGPACPEFRELGTWVYQVD